MGFDDEQIIEILQKLPSEGPCIDYKLEPYRKDQNHAFLKDVVAMLNSEAGAGQDKYIVVGVEDKTRKLVGIDIELWKDDNEWQNLIKKIAPRPDIRTGMVEYENKWFGWIYIPDSNNEWVYEIAETVVSSIKDYAKERNIAAKGQAFTRVGSVVEILMDSGRKKLINKKIQHIDYNNVFNRGVTTDPVPSIMPGNINEKITLAFVGSWNEKNKGDIELIEKLSNTTIDVFTDKIRVLSEQSPDLLSYSEGCWILKDHKAFLLAESRNIYDNHIQMFFHNIVKCFSSIDPKYSLPSDKRSYVQLYNMQREFSERIVRGIAETIAILGNNQNSFAKCSRNEVINNIYNFEKRFFSVKDWKVYATNEDILHLLGEAYPEMFLHEIRRLLIDKDEAFIKYMNEKEESITTQRYGYQIAWTISNIAKLDIFFCNAMEVLMLLSEIREDFIDIMVGIVLPWYPQTHASVSTRVEIFRELAKENNNVIWNALMKLMPRVTTTGNPLQDPEYMEIDPLSEKISKKDYYDATTGYINIANELMGTDVKRMCSMLSVIDDVDDNIQQSILMQIKQNANKLTGTDKSILWNKLQDFLMNHRKYADAEWALKEDRLTSIQELADWLVPDNVYLSSVRLFRNDQYTLLEEKGNYLDEEKKLRIKQKAVLRKIYNSGGINNLLEFVAKVENKRLAGACVGRSLNNEDVQKLIILQAENENNDFMDGVISSMPFIRLQAMMNELSDSIKAQTIARTPISDATVKYISMLNDESQMIYWRRVSAWPLLRKKFTMIDIAVNNLNKCERAEQSISILFDAIRDEKEVKPELVVDTLNLYVDIQQTLNHNRYHIQELIKWLQNKPVNKNDMLTIEWRFFPLLRESQGYYPIHLWNELSCNPDFYVKIMEIISGKEKDLMVTDEDKGRIAIQCYELMSGWKSIPGIDSSGKVDIQTLENWYNKTIELSKKNDVEKLSKNYFGKALFYAPAADDGFFINRDIARYLQEDREGIILSGYQAEAINSRGVHIVDPTGEPEFKLEKEYNEKAKAADDNGLFRLARVLRDIAMDYHEEGVQNRKGEDEND